MDTAFALSLYSKSPGDRCLFGYSGHFPDEHSARLIELGEAVLSDTGVAPATKGRLGYVMVEAYQNIVRHRAEVHGMPAWGAGRSLFMLRCAEHAQRVLARNPVLNKQAGKLDHALAALHGMDNAGLKRRFYEEIQRTGNPGTRGAGLGLIEIVRRSAGHVQWNFAPIDAAHAQFNLTLDLGAVPDSEPAGGADFPAGPMLGHHVVLFHAGHWTPAVLDVLLSIAAREFPVDRQRERTRTQAFSHLARQAMSIFGDLPVVTMLQEKAGVRLSMGAVVSEAAAIQLGSLVTAGAKDMRCLHAVAPHGVLAMVQMPW